MASDEKQQLVLHSSFEEMNKLEPFVNRLQNWASFEEDLHSRIMLALSEAVNNAIIHGNKQQQDKRVTVVAKLSGKQLQLSVEDEGGGFNPDKIPDPLEEENLLNEGGRGIYLITQYADEVHFENGGTKIAIAFQID